MFEYPGKLHNYDKLTESENDNLGTCYDHLSVMHYGPMGFNIDPSKPTLYTCDPTYQNRIGRAEKTSPVDIERIQVLYGCSQPVGSTYMFFNALISSGE